jgi:hypothetical protein
MITYHRVNHTFNIIARGEWHCLSNSTKTITVLISQNLLGILNNYIFYKPNMSKNVFYLKFTCTVAETNNVMICSEKLRRCLPP